MRVALRSISVMACVSVHVLTGISVLAVRIGIVKTLAVCSDVAMAQRSTRPPLCKGYRFPPEIISRCVWLYSASV